MRFINLIVVHCSATRCDRCYTEHDLTTDHLRRGFSGAGYHFISARTVTSSPCVPCPCLVPMSGVGMQVASVSATKAVLTSAVALPIHAPFSKHSLRVLVLLLLKDYPGSRLCGHRDLSP